MEPDTETVLHALQSIHKRRKTANLKHIKTRIFALTLVKQLERVLREVRRQAFDELETGRYRRDVPVLSRQLPLLTSLFNVLSRKRVSRHTPNSHTYFTLLRVFKSIKTRLLLTAFYAIRWKSTLAVNLNSLENAAKNAVLKGNYEKMKEKMVKWQLFMLTKNSKSRKFVGSEEKKGNFGVILMNLVKNLKMKRIKEVWKVIKSAKKDTKKALCLAIFAKNVYKKRLKDGFSTIFSHKKRLFSEISSKISRFCSILHIKRQNLLLFSFSSLQIPLQIIQNSSKNSQLGLFFINRVFNNRLRSGFFNVKKRILGNFERGKIVFDVWKRGKKKEIVKKLKEIVVLETEFWRILMKNRLNTLEKVRKLWLKRNFLHILKRNSEKIANLSSKREFGVEKEHILPCPSSIHAYIDDVVRVSRTSHAFFYDIPGSVQGLDPGNQEKDSFFKYKNRY